MMTYAVCGRLCERKWLRRIIAKTKAIIANRRSSPAPSPIDVPISAHTADRSVAAGLGWGTVLLLGVWDADAPVDGDGVEVDVPVGALVPLGDAPVESEGVALIVCVVVAEMLGDGERVIDGDGLAVIDAEPVIVGGDDGDSEIDGVADIEEVGDVLGIWAHMPLPAP